MAEWKSVPLADVLDFREGPGILAKDFREHGVPLVRLAGVKAGASILDGCNFLDSGMVEKKWRQFRLLEGDVLLSTSASLGEVAVVGPEGVGAVPYTGLIRFRPATTEIVAEYIPVALSSASFKRQIEAMGVGSVMRHFGPMHLRRMFIELPPKSVQRAIAEVLGALDDKIAANDRVARSADSLAAASYRSMLSEGSEAPLTSLADFVNGKAFTKGASGTGRVVIRIAELNSGIGGSTVYSDAEVDERHLARAGDVLFAWSGSLTLHRWFRPEAIVNQHIFKVIPKSAVPKWLVWHAVANQLDYFKAVAADKATTMGHIQRRHLDEMVTVPAPEEVASQDGLMSALWDRALAAEQESLRLVATRDALLAELMSGALRIKDAERLAEDLA